MRLTCVISTFVLFVSACAEPSGSAQERVVPSSPDSHAITSPADVKLGSKKHEVATALKECCSGQEDRRALWDLMEAYDADGRSWTIVFSNDRVAQIAHYAKFPQPLSASDLIALLAADLVQHCDGDAISPLSRIDVTLTGSRNPGKRPSRQLWFSCPRHKVTVWANDNGDVSVQYVHSADYASGPY